MTHGHDTRHMKTFLMCEPRYFEVRYAINPWMNGKQGTVDRALARRQWDRLYRTLSERAAIHLVEPVEGLPDMVFTANAGFVSKQREVIVSSFFHAERQPESAHFRKFFEDAGYRVRELDEAVRFEGAGDALYDSNGLVWAAHGIRSDANYVNQLAATLQLGTRELVLTSPWWYHLDTAFCPLAAGHAIAYAGAFLPASVALIDRTFGDKVIWVSEQDAQDFACNAVNINNDIILHKASDALKIELDKRGFRVIELDMSEFMKSGGSCKCLTLELY